MSKFLVLLIFLCSSSHSKLLDAYRVDLSVACEMCKSLAVDVARITAGVAADKHDYAYEALSKVDEEEAALRLFGRSTEMATHSERSIEKFARELSSSWSVHLCAAFEKDYDDCKLLIDLHGFEIARAALLAVSKLAPLDASSQWPVPRGSGPLPVYAYNVAKVACSAVQLCEVDHRRQPPAIDGRGSSKLKYCSVVKNVTRFAGLLTWSSISCKRKYTYGMQRINVLTLNYPAVNFTGALPGIAARSYTGFSTDSAPLDATVARLWPIRSPYSAKDPLAKETLSSLFTHHTECIAGVNGPFFYRIEGGGVDNICPQNKGQFACCSIFQDPLLPAVQDSTSCGAVPRGCISLSNASAPSVQLTDKGKRLTESGPMELAVGAGPRLYKNGKNVASGNPEQFPWMNDRTARTAVFTLSNGKQVLLTVDKRAPGVLGTFGMAISELAAFINSDLRSLLKWWPNDVSVVDALNLDGGGSTTAYIRGEGVVNFPSDGLAGGVERQIFAGLDICLMKRLK